VGQPDAPDYIVGLGNDTVILTSRVETTYFPNTTYFEKQNFTGTFNRTTYESGLYMEGLENIYPQGAARIFDHEMTLAYTLIMSIWATFFLEFWKRRQATLAYRWGMLDYEDEETTRPDWKPTHARKSPITGKYEKYVPSIIYHSKLSVSVLVVLFSILIVIIAVGSMIVFKVRKDTCDNTYP
jgi:Calcium-activated chloride channel